MGTLVSFDRLGRVHVRVSPEERFWRRVDKSDGCWLWTGAVNADGYGSFGIGSVWPGWPHSIGAHRFAYLTMVGPIPDGLQLDHLCRNRRCVRPDHLEPVTKAENMRRGMRGVLAQSKTHCAQGHELVGANRLVHVRAETGALRIDCRACKNRYKRAWRARRR